MRVGSAKTSISWETSYKFYAFNLKIDPASFSYKANFAKLKKYYFCDASTIFYATHKMLFLPQLLTPCHVCAALTMRSMEEALSPRHKMLCLPRNCETPHCKARRLPREDGTLALTRFQSIVPATQNTKAIANASRKMQQMWVLRPSYNPKTKGKGE